MIRFANPGSDINSLTRIFQVICEEFREIQTFCLDDISKVLVQRNLATSCGYAGTRALERSSREDRSRDPLYNQSKMYSEIFRLLGWIHPAAERRLTFEITWLGMHIQEAGIDAQPLVRECILGIAFPNEVVAAKGSFHLRPFAAILRALSSLDGLLCRDEMILGPMSLSDDTKIQPVDEMVQRIRKLRGSPVKLNTALKELSNRDKIQLNTLKNYTRFPLAVLEWSGWTEKVDDRTTYGVPIRFHRLTELGQRQAETIKHAVDLRGDCVAKQPKEHLYAIAKLSAISMLERAGFETLQLSTKRAEWIKTLLKAGVLKTGSEVILFSPFQELGPSLTKKIFDASGALGYLSSLGQHPRTYGSHPGREVAIMSRVRLIASSTSSFIPHHGPLAARIIQQISRGRSIEQIAQAFMHEYEHANKASFYPTVAELFLCLGYDCQVSRGGVNYQRSDAFIIHPTDSAPIEIKSPSEELMISVKGVRQALENKIILLARQAAPTRRSTTSLLVGFMLPADRAEVSEIVNDIYRAFGLSIGVIDFKSLICLVALCLKGAKHDMKALLSLRGFIDVATS